MSDTDWAARARREATAILAEFEEISADYPTLIGLVAMGWLQGFNLGAHETLAIAEDAFRRLQVDLT